MRVAVTVTHMVNSFVIKKAAAWEALLVKLPARVISTTEYRYPAFFDVFFSWEGGDSHQPRWLSRHG